MAKLALAPGVKPTKAKRGSQKPAHRRWHYSGWMTTAKVVFLLQRRRRRKEEEKKSSPSPRQIALVVVSGGLLILVIRVASQRIRSRAVSVPAECQDTAPAESQDTAPEEPQDTAPTESQDAAPEASTTDGASTNAAVTATQSPLTDRVQSEMSRHNDAPAPATGAD